MKQTQSAVPTNPSAASLGRDRREKSEITDIRRFCFAFWELPSTEELYFRIIEVTFQYNEHFRIIEMWRTQLENPTCGEKSFSAETLVFCRARQGESIPPLSVVIREDGHVW